MCVMRGVPIDVSDTAAAVAFVAAAAVLKYIASFVFVYNNREFLFYSY